MPETLLSFSEVLLFGRLIKDLQIPFRDADKVARVATIEELAAAEFKGKGPIDGKNLNVGDVVLVHLQKKKAENGLYTVTQDVADPPVFPWTGPERIAKRKIVRVMEGDDYANTFWEQTTGAAGKQIFKEVSSRVGRGLGLNKLLEGQLGNDARFARIYGFSYEGAFYDLPAPTIFLVHGKGDSPTSWKDPGGGPPTRSENAPGGLASRAPNEPSLSGVAAADFQIADDIRVWPYDKADYSIRMDVLTGQLEQILLDVFFEVEAPMIAGGRVAGGRVAGGRVAGGRVAGGRVAGGRVAGGRVSGGRVGGSSD